MRRLPRKPLLVAGWALLSVLAGLLLLSAQRQDERDLRERFADRTAVGARFTETYARDLMAQERRVAETELAGRVSTEEFRRVVDLFGYEAAVLLDGRGRAIHVAPAAPGVVGEDLAKKYGHLRSAVAGQATVSKVVPSAAEGTPIVAFATPFGTGPHRRVFSGAFDVARTPIGAYLRNAAPLGGSRVYLVDLEGAVVASHRGGRRATAGLAVSDPSLASALERSEAGETEDGFEFASRPVAGTPWRLIVSVPHAELFEPLEGLGRYVPWLLWLGFVLGALACALLLSNLIASGATLRTAVRDLDRLAHVDSLTGIDNRRQIGEHLEAAVATATRHDQPLSMLMIDVDHFKAVNDDHGHDAGDAVLRTVAERLSGLLRIGDRVGRWGGEEFLVLLPVTDLVGAAVVADRICTSVAATPIVIGRQVLNVTVSVGAASHHDEGADALVERADRAMYAAKAAGRAIAVVAPDPVAG